MVSAEATPASRTSPGACFNRALLGLLTSQPTPATSWSHTSLPFLRVWCSLKAISRSPWPERSYWTCKTLAGCVASGATDPADGVFLRIIPATRTEAPRPRFPKVSPARRTGAGLPRGARAEAAWMVSCHFPSAQRHRHLLGVTVTVSAQLQPTQLQWLGVTVTMPARLQPTQLQRLGELRCILPSLDFSLLFRQIFKLKPGSYFLYEISESTHIPGMCFCCPSPPLLCPLAGCRGGQTLPREVHGL